MAFSLIGLAVVTSSGNKGSNTSIPATVYSYKSSTDTLATISASAYFNNLINELKIGDVIFVEGSDDRRLMAVAGVTTNVTIEAYSTAGDIALTTGSMLIGAASVAAEIDVSGDGKILVGNGTTATSVAVSGLVGLTNAGVTSLVLAEGSGYIGTAGGVAAALDMSGDGKIVVGNGTTVTSVAVSGDVTLTNAGVATITAGDGNIAILSGTGDPSASAAKGSLYIKTDASTTTSRLWINTDGSTTWTYFTSNA